MKTDRIKPLLAGGQPARGAWLGLPSPSSARLEYDGFGGWHVRPPARLHADHRLGTALHVLDRPAAEQGHPPGRAVPVMYKGRVDAVGRYQPDLGHSGPLTDKGSALARKRTSLFEVRQDGLAYLTDLPSDGDTAYEGLVIVGDTAYISYYTSPINHDYAWILGMLSPSQVRMAKVDLKALEALANQTPAH